ncbi:hypothetical protein EF294_17045 [Gordonia oryzae]|uniref:Uncharacterized protein n=1 Tax=Gordonia oryzae TaxID=2487349 RepID=A0A3N4GFF4_9ACTN|nr:hypothetical protein [Gordonia oryzae]RPA57791.1 hypothetical protein EF294_17045 [Gordonia oryzae]
MSYDLYVLPWHLATDAASAEQAMQVDFGTDPDTCAHSMGSPLTDLVTQIVEGQRERGIEHETPEPMVSGVYVTASWGDVVQSRMVVIPLAADHGFDVYDPQENLYIATEHSVPVSVAHGNLGRFPLLSACMLTELVDRLGQPEPYIVIERDTEVYVQSRARDDGRFDLEYRDGSADRHFATITDADRLPELLWAWTVGGPATLSDVEWSKLRL